MRTFLLSLFLSSVTLGLLAQPQFDITELDTMPMPIANNAVVAATVQSQQYVYSFGGIGTGLTYADITQQAFRYSLGTDTWDTLPPLPDTLGKIASAASYVNGKIYIIGGYHVMANGDEVSSNRVHIFDPTTNTYLPDGAPVPLPIDDHVQAVWRDSLIYVVAGWSNTGHVTNVQIYNPSTNTWSVGTAAPNTIDYRAFGASGVIIADTIYYMGGARTGLTFPPAPELRKGVINPNDPNQITWSYTVYFYTAGYRMAPAIIDGWAIWAGGGGNTYNYNAAAYDGSGVVVPENRIILYNPELDSLVIYTDSLQVPAMDFRGVGQLSDNSFLLCGGILDNAEVSNRTFLFQNKLSTGIQAISNSLEVMIYPVPATDVLNVELPIAANITLMDLSGKAVLPLVYSSGKTTTMYLGSLPAGLYLLRIETSEGTQVRKVMVSGQ
jgi:hypothetical protein